MPKKLEKPSRFIQEMLETARGMHASGLMPPDRMNLIETLSAASVPDYSGKRIEALRKKNHLSQEAFALLLHARLSTVQQWERGARRPSRPYLRLLQVLDRKGLEAFQF